MFPFTDTARAARPTGARRAPAAPRAAAAPNVVRRVAGALRAFALLEEPELEPRAAGHAHPHHAVRRVRVRRARRPGAVRTPPQPCRSPLPR